MPTESYQCKKNRFRVCLAGTLVQATEAGEL